MDKRTLLAVTLSFLVLVGYQFMMVIFYPPTPTGPTPTVQAQEAGPSVPATPPEALKPTKESAPKLPVPTVSSDPNSFASFDNGVVKGRISLQGARLTDLWFLKHLDTLGEKGIPIHYLETGGDHPFFAETGYLAQVGVKVPDLNSVWQVVGEKDIKGKGDITLQWDNGQGLLFQKIFSFSDIYLFTVTDRVTNSSGAPFDLYHFAQFVRVKPAPNKDDPVTTLDYEGPMGFIDGVRHQSPYDDIQEHDAHVNGVTGWTGINDKYFLAAWILNSTGDKRFYFDYDAPAHRVGKVSPKAPLQPGAHIENTVKAYVGPKAIKDLESLNIDLDRSIDYGWFHFLARPLMEMLIVFESFLGNLGLAIILLTVIIKALFYPLADKSYRSMNSMKKLQPKVEQLKQLYGDDKMRLNQEMMALYKEHKVNPLGGCLPVVVQIPVFFALYKVLYLSIEMRHAPFFLWIHDLSAKDPFYVLPLLMGASMFYQSKLSPQPADPVQAKMMLFLPVIFTILFLQFPAGLVLYWIVNNVLSITQQVYIYKKMDQ